MHPTLRSCTTFALLLLLTACGAGKQPNAGNLQGEAARTTPSSSAASAGPSLPVTWAPDVPVYPGSTVTLMGPVISQGRAAMFHTSDALPMVMQYFTKQIVVSGWHIEHTAESGPIAIIKATKGGRLLMIQCHTKDDGVGITMSIGEAPRD